MRTRRRIALIATLAVAGIAIAALITWGTSQLVSQRIGLASEPLTAGERLLPPTRGPAGAPTGKPRSTSTSQATEPGRRATSPSVTSAPAVTAPPVATAPASGAEQSRAPSEGGTREGTQASPEGRTGEAPRAGEHGDSGARRDD